MWDEPLYIGSRSFSSRLIVGTDKYASLAAMRRCHELAGAELAIVAVRGIDPARQEESILEAIDAARTALLPSTAGSYTSDEAIRTAHLGREAGLGELVKLVVHGPQRDGYPDVQAVLEATKSLALDGFTVLAAGNDDPVVARRIQDAGAAAVLVLTAPPGSGAGLRNPHAIGPLLGAVSVPVIAHGGIGTASDAAQAMELGCHAVMVESAIALASDPEGMAEAVKLAVQAGRFARRAGRIGRQ
jgi:thiazole synthase